MKSIIRWGIVGVLLIAAVLRLGALPTLPVGLHYDEAANLILTQEIVEGSHPLFIRAYTGKEVLFFYLAAPWVWMTGGAPWGLRLGAAMIGLLTVAATFAAVRALLLGRPKRSIVALLAAGWMAVMFPHVLLSRYGFRAIAQPLLQALTVAALWRGLRTPSRLGWRVVGWRIAAGVLLGLTGYTYLAARLFPIPLGISLVWLLMWSQVHESPRRRRRRAGAMGLVLAVAALTFAPLGIFFLQQPDAFMTRIDQVAAPSWAEAMEGVWRCLRALVWPGMGDPYVRFNRPGMPVLDPVSGLFAVVGLALLLFVRSPTPLERAGRLMVVTAIFVMILPSALATGEITPSNLRMVGIYPFIAVLPAWGLAALLGRLRTGPGLAGSIVLALLLVGGWWIGARYRGWASSAELFRAADGEMMLAAEALDELVAPDTTVYIASVHYRHPTVAALADHYEEAKWLTGGATLVLPSHGAMVYLAPANLAPPAPWPERLTTSWTSTARADPEGEPALWVHTLSASRVAKLRQAYAAAGEAADFAHIVEVLGARPMLSCEVAAPCPVLVTWAPQRASTALQPVIRLRHPETGEWARAMAFHYAAEQWSPEDLVLDQLVVTPPVGMPPGDDYQVAVMIYDAQADQPLPRLSNERFAGLEVRFPEEEDGFSLAPMREPAAVRLSEVCPGVPQPPPISVGGINLLGSSLAPQGELLPGRELSLRLCWQAQVASPALREVQVVLEGERRQALYAGEPVPGYPTREWRRGEVVEARQNLRLPRSLADGRYEVTLHVGDEVVLLGSLDVQPVARTFTVPEVTHPQEVAFSSEGQELVGLLGYDVGELRAGTPLTLTLYWQAREVMEESYQVFIHVRDVETGHLVAQVDEHPQSGAYPTSLWIEGEVVIDPHIVSIPETLASGTYELYVGLYLPTLGTHLSARLDAGSVDAYPLGEIKAEPMPSSEDLGSAQRTH